MRSFRGASLATLALSLVLAACGAGESLPDDPRPAASHEAVVPPAAVSAVLAIAPPKKPYLAPASP
jgi:hypothetical protein